MRRKSVIELLFEVTEKSGDSVAIEWGSREITYTELEKNSSHLSNYLLSNGVARGSVIAVAIQDPVELITAIVGILRAGCAFAPLDLRYPDKRLESMIATVSPRWFIVGSESARRLRKIISHCGETSEFTLVDVGHGSEALRRSTTAHETCQEYSDPFVSCIDVDNDDISYVYFTSGSTGEPKAIAGCHKGLSHFIQWEIKTFDVHEGYRVSQLTPPSFDPFLRDVFVPLCSGGTICVPEDGGLVLDTERLINWINDRKINLAHCVPTVFRAIVNQQPPSTYFQSLEYVLIAGEQLFPAEVKKWMNIYGSGVQLVNLYGPTETTLAKFCHFIEPSDTDRRSIPVGKPIEGARALVLGDDGRPCPRGVVGEVYIKTPFRTLGYYNQPEATKEVFVPNPLSGDPRDIVYKTGDMGRVLNNGDFEILGRKDNQVKVRGVRVELGEVEGFLRAHRLIKDAVIKDWRDANGETFLCAYVVSERELENRELRDFLWEYLPEEMVPSVFVRLEELPLNLNGKVDRRALPNPSERVRQKTEYVAPRNEIEERLVQIWYRILQVERIGINDNFFDLGGHSLSGTQMLLRVNKEFQVDLPLRVLFELPTIAQLAAAMVLERAEQVDDEMVARLLAEIRQLSEGEVQTMLLVEKQSLARGGTNA